MPENHARSMRLKQHPSTNPFDIPSARFSLLALAATYTLFVIYGSLVPLNYQHHSWQEAFEAFRNIRYLNLGIGSRADWVANILLFVPLAFLWLGTLWHSKNIVWRVVATLSVLLACSGLRLGIEFTQIFFPPPHRFAERYLRRNPWRPDRLAPLVDKRHHHNQMVSGLAHCRRPDGSCAATSLRLSVSVVRIQSSAVGPDHQPVNSPPKST